MIRQRRLGEINGMEVAGFRISGGDTEIEVMSFGATLTRVERPDRFGKIANIALGHGTLGDYAVASGNAGAICGRHANRLADGRFILDGDAFQLTRNHGRHHLHGGRPHFGQRHWSAEFDVDANCVTFRINSPHGDQGYPGTLDAEVSYRLDDEGTLHIRMRAVCDRPTIVNLVHHGYWNLTGDGDGTVDDHVLKIAASHYTPTNFEKFPTGQIMSVRGTPFDFTAGKAIGTDMSATSGFAGYDHNLCIDGHDGTLRPVCSMLDPATGRSLSMRSNQPGLQLYTKHQPLPTLCETRGTRRVGVALETQNFPNAPNLENFPSSELRPGEVYRHDMELKFGQQ